MRVLFDLQAFSMQEYGGVSRYIGEVAGGIARLHPEVDVSFAGRFAADNIHLRSLGVPTSTALHTYRGRGRGRIALLADRLNQRLVDARLRSGATDVLHATYYHTRPAADIPVPVVLTVHDMIHELFEDLPRREWTMEHKRAAIRRADHLIVPSVSTAEDVTRILGVDAGTITVIPHGSTFVGDEPDRGELVTPDRYLLYVGVRYSYKGFRQFCEAVGSLARSFPGLKGVVAGGGAFTPDEHAMMGELGVSGIIVHIPCDDECLPTLYRRAALFIAPSLYEGFGLPVVEAMQFGTPSVVSASSSLPEVGGDAVAYFEPGSVASLVDVAGSLLSDEPARRGLSEAGYERARRFTWERSVDAHLAVYSALIS